MASVVRVLPADDEAKAKRQRVGALVTITQRGFSSAGLEKELV